MIPSYPTVVTVMNAHQTPLKGPYRTEDGKYFKLYLRSYKSEGILSAKMELVE